MPSTATEAMNNHAPARRRSSLTPVAYSDALMPSLQLAKSSRFARRLAVVLSVLLVATILLMAFAPWQQTVTGGGYVVAYAPRERQQVLEALAAAGYSGPIGILGHREERDVEECLQEGIEGVARVRGR